MDALLELEFLQRLALAAAQTLDPPSLVRLVISETTEAMGVDVCSVYLAEPDGRTLVLSATNGLSQGGVGRVRLRVGEGITGHAAATHLTALSFAASIAVELGFAAPQAPVSFVGLRSADLAHLALAQARLYARFFQAVQVRGAWVDGLATRTAPWAQLIEA